MATVTETSATQQLVMFTIADEDYGIPITQVQEIIHYAAPRPMPGSSPEVEGVINLRGRLIPVVNLRTCLGLHGEARSDSKVVIVELEKACVGLVVDEVREVISIDPASTEPPPVGVLSGSHSAIQSVAKIGDRILVILDPVRLLALDEA